MQDDVALQDAGLRELTGHYVTALGPSSLPRPFPTPLKARDPKRWTALTWTACVTTSCRRPVCRTKPDLICCNFTPPTVICWLASSHLSPACAPTSMVATPRSEHGFH